MHGPDMAMEAHEHERRHSVGRRWDDIASDELYRRIESKLTAIEDDRRAWRNRPDRRRGPRRHQN